MCGNLSKALFLGFMTSFVWPIEAQMPAPVDLLFDHVSVEAGLSQTSVFAMLQDHAGYLWFGTEDGLNKFDGYEFTVYRHLPRQSDSISDNWISALHEDRWDRLWIATRGGVDRFDRTTSHFSHFPVPASGSETWCVYEYPRENLWFGTDVGLFRFDLTEQRFHRVSIGTGTSVGVRSVLEDGSGGFWLATWGGGLAHLEPQSSATVLYRHDERMSSTISSDNVRVLLTDSSGTLWVGTERGLDSLDPKTGRFRHRLPVEGEPALHITALFEDGRKNLWVGTWGDGLFILSPARHREIRVRHNPANPQSLSHDTVWSILQDRSGVLWIGSGVGGGLNKLILTPRFKHYRFAPTETISLSNNLVWAVHQDNMGDLWIGTWDGLDFIDRESSRVRHYREEPGNPSTLSSNRIWAIVPDGDTSLWLGTYNAGLNLLDKRTGRVARGITRSCV